MKSYLFENYLFDVVGEISLPAYHPIVSSIVNQLPSVAPRITLERGVDAFLGSYEETPLPSRTVVGADLLRERDDFSIAISLNNEHLTAWADLKELLQLQSHGEAGNLLTNGRANVFYLLNQKEAVAMTAYWFNDHWQLEELAISNKSSWRPGNRFFFYKTVS